MSFPPATEMFQFAGFALPNLCIQFGVPLRVGFPIQKFPDQSFIASSPKLIAGLHVFHRLLPPRHPPCALSRLIL
jgi:hypothetical protein